MADVMKGMEEDLEVVEEDDDDDRRRGGWRGRRARPVVKLVNSLIADAVRKGASDIHIEPYEKKLRVRYRIDGVLQEMMAPPFKLQGGDHLAPEDHGRAGHRRAPRAAGRPHQDQGR